MLSLHTGIWAVVKSNAPVPHSKGQPEASAVAGGIGHRQQEMEKAIKAAEPYSSESQASRKKVPSCASHTEGAQELVVAVNATLDITP